MFRRPILLIAFNNQRTTAQVLASLRAVAPARLYYAVDGPRARVKGEADAVAAVRDLTALVDWPCEMDTLFPTGNRGPRVAVSSAIDWFFEREESGVILEHDCVADPSFFVYCDRMLERYRRDDRVMHISGNFFQPGPIGEASYYFSRIPHIWGWATWRRAWQHYDVAMSDWIAYRDSGGLERTIPWPWQRQKWIYILNKVSHSRAQTWDYQWTYTLFKHQGLAVTPNANLVSNIGFGPGAVHGTNPRSPFANMKAASMGDGIVHPESITASAEADLFTCRHNFSFNPLKVLIGNAVTRLSATRRAAPPAAC